MRTGTRLGAYEIVDSLGAGGMGEVYRARDTRLDRDVAVKVLPAELAADPERLARLEREAKVLAQLEHPNVAAVYGLERYETAEGGSGRFLVMQLADGHDLADRMAASGALPVPEAVAIALQIASGLEAAHERGIVHRDLKPANVMVDDDGAVKVLDFGLAKALGPEASDSSPELTASPTVLGATVAGTIMGTAGYMSPEQARGKRVDKRADIWAFGCVLWEMLTGRRLFDGETVTDVIAAVVTRDFDWEQLPEGLSPTVVTLLRRCLERDPRTRLRDIGEARVALERADRQEAEVVAPAAAGPGGRRIATMAAVIFAAGVLLTLGALWLFDGGDSGGRSAGRATRVTLEAPDWGAVGFSGGLYVMPDGRTVGYHDRETGALRLRDLDSWESRTVPGTEYSRDGFLSPDGRWFVYRDGRGASIEKILVDGGTPVVLVNDVGIFNTGVWSDSGWLYFSASVGADDGIWRMRSNGEDLELLMPRDGTANGWFVEVLPDDRAILFTTQGSDPASMRVDALMLEDRTVRPVAQGARQAHYLDSGHLVVVTGDSDLSVAGFDADAVALRGPLRRAEQGVRVDGGAFSARYNVSRGGTLVYVPSSDAGATGQALWWSAQDGLQDGIQLPTGLPGWGGYRARLSPDATTLLIGVGPEQWLVDAEQGISTPLQLGSQRFGDAAWSRDGSRLAVLMERPAGRGGFLDTVVATLAADGSTHPQQLALFPDVDPAEPDAANGRLAIGNWSSDDRRIVVERDRAMVDGRDVWVLSAEPEVPPEPFAATAADERSPSFSPQGGWIAYLSDRTGTDEVYVRPYPGPGREIAVSSGGAAAVAWRPDGRALYFLRLSAEGPSLWQVALSDGPTPRPSSPRRLADLPSGVDPFLDVDPVSGRVLLAAHSDAALPETIRIVLDWSDELLRLRER